MTKNGALQPSHEALYIEVIDDTVTLLDKVTQDFEITLAYREKPDGVAVILYESCW